MKLAKYNLVKGQADLLLLIRDNEGKIKATLSLLIRKLPYINACMMYAPRGPVCDIDDEESFKKLIEEADKLAKKYKAFMLKIDPYVEYQERDNNGDIVEEGNNNKDSHKNLIDLGYKHFGFNNVGFHLGSEDVTMDVDGEITKEMLRRVERLANEAVVKNLDVKVIYPIHMNPAVRQAANEELGDCDRIHIIEPLDVLDFHNFLSRGRGHGIPVNIYTILSGFCQWMS